MKKYLFILLLSLSASFAGFSQGNDSLDRGGKLADRMKEYIQKKLNLSSGEAEKFSPVFMRYLLELRRTHREFKADVPVLRLKIAEIRVKFRDEFRQILDEQRANRVFQHEKEFEDKIRDEVKERGRQRLRGGDGPRIRAINPRAI